MNDTVSLTLPYEVFSQHFAFLSGIPFADVMIPEDEKTVEFSIPKQPLGKNYFYFANCLVDADTKYVYFTRNVAGAIFPMISFAELIDKAMKNFLREEFQKSFLDSLDEFIGLMIYPADTFLPFINLINNSADNPNKFFPILYRAAEALQKHYWDVYKRFCNNYGPMEMLRKFVGADTFLHVLQEELCSFSTAGTDHVSRDYDIESIRLLFVPSEILNEKTIMFKTPELVARFYSLLRDGMSVPEILEKLESTPDIELRPDASTQQIYPINFNSQFTQVPVGRW